MAQSSSLLLVVDGVVACVPVDADEVAPVVVVARVVVVVVRGVVVARVVVAAARRGVVVVARCFAFAEVVAFAEVDPGREFVFLAGVVGAGGAGVVVGSTGDAGTLGGGAGAVVAGTADAGAPAPIGTGTPKATADPPVSASAMRAPRAVAATAPCSPPTPSS